MRQAKIYEREGNEQMAYFLLYRHARLILSSLSQHPNAKDPKHRKAWAEARREVDASLAKLELLKPRINKRYQRYDERRKALAAQAEAEASRGGDSAIEEGMAAVSLNSRASIDGSNRRGSSPTRLDPLKHQDMAVDQANREIQRRIGKLRKRNITQQQGDRAQGDELGLREVREQLDRSERDHVPPRTSSKRNSLTKAYRYPAVPSGHQGGTNQPAYGEDRLPTFTSIHQQPYVQTLPPQRPPKEGQYAQNSTYPPSHYAPGPPLPDKTPMLPSPPPSPTPAHQFTSSARLENGQSLRTIFLPQPLRHHFTRIAEPNTAARLETCGILCGTLVRNAFFVTKLVIPEQTSTSDTCEMINEEDLYGYIDAQPEDLMVLGWIHTHPTQTCFMSSRDLHTHVWYQVQLPESIAIVCSPSKDPDWGVFRLTDPPGVGAIKACSKPGIFHPHDETRLFTDVLGRPGHVIEHEALRFETVDLRK